MHRDWFDWASLIFNTLATSAGLVGLFIAIGAYKIARDQQRNAYDLEILRELHEIAVSPRFARAFEATAGDDVYAADMAGLFVRFGVKQHLMHLLLGRQQVRQRLEGWYYLSCESDSAARIMFDKPLWMETLGPDKLSAQDALSALDSEIRFAIHGSLSPRAF